AQVYETVRADAAELAEREQEIEHRKALVQRLCDAVSALETRINTLADELELKHRVDAEERARQAELDEEEIPPPPGISGPGVASDYDAHEHRNAGDLHVLPAKNPDTTPASDDEEEDIPSLPPAPEFNPQPTDAGGVAMSYGTV